MVESIRYHVFFIFWLSFCIFKENRTKPEKKPYKTSYELPKDPKFAGEMRCSVAYSDKEILRLREKLLNEITAPSHIISEILARFSELFLNKYLIFFSADPHNDLEMLTKSFRGDISILMQLIKELIEKWYLSIILQIPCLAKNRHRRGDFMDILINLTIFSNTNNIYYTLHNLYGLTNNENERRLDRLMEILKDIRPENMEINPVFALDKCDEPYSSVINLLNEQSSHISAYEKFIIICRLKDEIMESIERYWEEWDPNIPAQKLMIDSDQLLTIVTYCIVKTRNCKLISYLAFIREFVGRNQLENSYYFTTYDAAMNYLLKLEEGDLLKIAEKK